MKPPDGLVCRSWLVRCALLLALGVLLAHAVIVPATVVAQKEEREPSQRGSARYQEWLRGEVRRKLVTLPLYSVFDHFAFRVQGYRVVLLGQVTRPSLKSDAERAVRKIEGVEGVTNKIEVLPVSLHDDRLRQALYRAIYGHSSLQRYSLQAVPPIHIIVKGGHVRLEGVVATKMERNIANLQANGVPGVFSVTNNLRVEK